MGKIYCRECGTLNEDSDNFCNSCGESLHGTKKAELRTNGFNNHIFIIIALIGVIFLLGVGIFSTGIFTPKIPLETADFGYFEADIPEGSSFEQYNSMGRLMPIYDNTGKYSEEISGISFSKTQKKPNVAGDLVEENGNMKLYSIAKKLREDSGKDFYELIIEKDGLYFDLSGENPDLLKQVAETIVVKNNY